MPSRREACRFLFLPALFCLLLHPASAANAPNPIIRVHLTRPNVIRTAFVSCDHPFLIEDSRGMTLAQAPADAVYSITWLSPSMISLTSGIASTDPESSETGAQASPVSAATSQITIYSSGGILEIAAGTSAIPIWHRYRGDLSIVPNASQLTLCNLVPLETYLLGVLGPEIGANSPMEAMKAQAIAARTYAIRNLSKLAAENADVDDTTRTQSYTGTDTETPAVCEAVAETQGKIMTYQGQLIDAVYSTDCGGRTALGPASEPYLQPVDDPGCAAKAGWTYTIPLTQLDQLVTARARQMTSAISNLEIQGTDNSGRVTSLQIDGTEGGNCVMTGEQFRQALGVDRVRSTCFTLMLTPDRQCLLTGRGWGHGLGMCQRGAIAMARGDHPASYWEILTHYYTGVQIVSLTPDLLPQTRTQTGGFNR